MSGNIIPMPRMGTMTSAAMPAGCCPPGGMAGLAQCYAETAAALAFFSTIMVDLMNNDPNVQAAMVAGIGKSGAPVALQGVTDGSAAAAGDVGEVFQNTVPALPYTAVYSTQLVPLGVLPAGDWLLWLSLDTFTTAATVVTGVLAPLPAGFAALTLGGQGPAQGTTIVSKPGHALIATATAMQAQVGVQGSGAGTCSVNIHALRVR